VPIPANAGAVALSFKDGSIHEKDAKWLLTSMRKEVELIEQELARPTNEKEKSMTEEQAQAMLDAMTKQSEAITALTEKVEAQATTIEDLKQAQTTQPPAETDEEKQAREAKEAEEAEAARKAEEAKNGNPPAKSGDDDQGGAGEEEIDEDAELTPEQEAEAREALGLAPAA
jgi:hypothetical protein